VQDATPARHAGSAARARRRLQEQGLRASDSVLTAGGAAGTPRFVASPDGAAARRGAAAGGSPPGLGLGPRAGSATGRAGGALPGGAPRYRVVMFQQYPRELLRGWLRQHHIREDEVDFRVLPGAAAGR